MRSRPNTDPLVLTLTVLALILAGPAVAGEGGAATIEELIEMCRSKKSLAELVPLVHPDDQPNMGFSIMMMGAFAPMMAMQGDASPEEQEAAAAKIEAEFEALQKKHGLREPPEDAPAGDTPEGLAMRARYTFDGVDIAAFIADTEKWLAETIGEEGKPGTADFSKLENLQVEGDSASATLDGAPIEFTRVDGRWYLRLDM